MKKYLTLVPAALLTACTLAGCGGNNSINKLDEFVRNLKGEITLEMLFDDEKGLFVEGVIDSGDKLITGLTTSYSNYGPRWNWVDGLTEEEYADLCVLQFQETEFVRYDDRKVETVEYTKTYPYNPECIGDDPEYPECIDYENPSIVAADTLIWEDNGTANYVYTATNAAGQLDPSDAWSFKGSRDTQPKLMDEIGSIGGNSALLLTDMADAIELMDYYENGYVEAYPLIGHERVTQIEHEEGTGKLHVRHALEIAKETDYEGEHVSPISAQAVWGDEFAGYYFRQYRSFYYDFTINNGIIESGDFGFGGVARALYKDNNWKEGDDCPHYPLTVAEEATLDLYMPETVVWPEEGEIPNPYTGNYAKIAPGGNPFQTDSFKATTEKQGEYKGSLPTLDSYREADATDFGSTYLPYQDFLDLDIQ